MMSSILVVGMSDKPRFHYSVEAGFTLLELMVTVSIAVVLLVIAVPNLSNLYRSARLSTQTDLLVSSLNEARLEAVKRRTLVTVCSALTPDTAISCAPTSSAGEIALAKTYWSNGWIITDGATIFKRIQAKDGLTIDSVSAPPKIDFSGTLGSAGTIGTFKLCTKGQTEQQVDIGLSGHVSKRINVGTICP